MSSFIPLSQINSTNSNPSTDTYYCNIYDVSADGYTMAVMNNSVIDIMKEKNN